MIILGTQQTADKNRAFFSVIMAMHIGVVIILNRQMAPYAHRRLI